MDCEDGSDEFDCEVTTTVVISTSGQSVASTTSPSVVVTTSTVEEKVCEWDDFVYLAGQKIGTQMIGDHCFDMECDADGNVVNNTIACPTQVSVRKVYFVCARALLSGYNALFDARATAKNCLKMQRFCEKSLKTVNPPVFRANKSSDHNFLTIF